MDTPAQNWSRSASLRKQVTGELALVPRGSQPTTSKRPPLHWSKSAHDSPTTVTPLAPGPPGSTNTDPMRSCGRLARWRRTARSMCSPFGRSQSNGTDSFPHCNWSSSANGGSQPVHAMPAASGAARSGDGPACAVLTAPTADIATPHTATMTDRMIARGRRPPLTPLLVIANHPSADEAPEGLHRSCDAAVGSSRGPRSNRDVVWRDDPGDGIPQRGAGVVPTTWGVGGEQD